MEQILKTFTTLFTGLSFQRLVLAILFLGVILLALLGIDWYTSYFTLGRLERATGILERLAALDGQTSERGLVEIRHLLTQELTAVMAPRAWPWPQLSMLAFWKIVAGAAPWLLLMLAFLGPGRDNPDSWTGLVGALFFACVFGAIGLFIPDELATWPGLILYSIGHFSIVLMLVVVAERRKRKRKGGGAAS